VQHAGERMALNTAETSERRTGKADRIDVPTVLLFYLGISFLLPQWTRLQLLYVTTPLLAALALAWLGWTRHRQVSRVLRIYLVLAAMLTAGFLLSSVYLWDSSAVFWAVTTGVWLVVIVPGIAQLLVEPRYRRALVLGLGCGAAYYGFARILGVVGVGPKPLFGAYGVVQRFQGAKRNVIDIQVLFVLPLLLWHGHRRGRTWRWIFAAFAVLWLLFSGGRVGPLTLALIALAAIVLQPNFGGRLRVVVWVLLLAVLTLGAMRGVGGQAAVASNRIVSTVNGERSSGDEIRDLLLRRAWHLGWEHPVFGVGYGEQRGRTDPVLHDARSAQQAQQVQDAGAHNFYAWAFASFGFPATVALIALLGFVLLLGVAHRRHADVRAATIAHIAVIFVIWFHPLVFDLMFYPFMIVLGTVMQYRESATPTPQFASRSVSVAPI
jgi:O-antigen ligase